MKRPNSDARQAAEQVQSPEQLQEKIRQRAYELYEQRGSQHGRDFEDWLTAEAEISGNLDQGHSSNGR